MQRDNNTVRPSLQISDDCANLNYKIIDSPFLWSGKKTKLLDQLLPLFPKECDLFVDMFGGTGSVIVNTTNLEYKQNIYNDLYMGNIIKDIYNNNYDYILKHCENRIQQFNLSKENKEGYYKFKSTILDEKDNNNKGLDLFCLSLFAFNGRLEFNQQKNITSSFGKRNRFNVVKPILKEFKIRFHEVKFCKQGVLDLDYLELANKIITLKKNKPYLNIFVYCDVPYSITRINGYRSSYNDEDMLCLLDKFNELNIKFGMSNVLEHKSFSNDLLKKWTNKYKICYLNFGYNNTNNSNLIEKNLTETQSTKEVYICNY